VTTAQQHATDIVRTLRERGHQAYFAGGCVRDLLLGREPADYDVATDATPQQVMRIFPQTFAVGAQFGVVLVPLTAQTTEDTEKHGGNTSSQDAIESGRVVSETAGGFSAERSLSSSASSPLLSPALLSPALKSTVEVATFRSDVGYSMDDIPMKCGLRETRAKTCSGEISPSMGCCSIR